MAQQKSLGPRKMCTYRCGCSFLATSRAAPNTSLQEFLDAEARKAQPHAGHMFIVRGGIDGVRGVPSCTFAPSDKCPGALPPIRHFGMVTALREEHVPEYLRVHAGACRPAASILCGGEDACVLASEHGLDNPSMLWCLACLPILIPSPVIFTIPADSFPGVRDLLVKYNLHNFNIFTQRLGGTLYEFLFHEYRGGSFESDMAALEAEPRNALWHKLCDPMQAHPCPERGGAASGGDNWVVMDRVFFNA